MESMSPSQDQNLGRLGEPSLPAGDDRPHGGLSGEANMNRFANQREPAPVQGTAAALPNNGGTAAGSVGVAVPLSLLAAG